MAWACLYMGCWRGCYCIISAEISCAVGAVAGIAVGVIGISRNMILTPARVLGLLGGCLMMALPHVANADPKTPPYWASISANEARMRVGPSLDYPSNWVYRRRDLPVKVVQILGNWRKIEDPSGTQGWMHVRLLSDTATAMISVAQADMRDKPSDDARLLYRVEKGVVGRVGDCDDGWCVFDVTGQRGFVRISALWGAAE